METSGQSAEGTRDSATVSGEVRRQHMEGWGGLLLVPRGWDPRSLCKALQWQGVGSGDET